MSWIKPDGRECERPVERKSRGKNLSLEGAIRIRDLIALTLVVDLGLSGPDAELVLRTCAITTTHMRRRLKQIPPGIRSGFAELRREVGAEL